MDDWPIPIIRARNGDTGYFKRTPVEDWANVRGRFPDSVLMVSVYNNHLHCTKVIYERCPDLLLQRSGAFNFNPLHWAAHEGVKPSLMKFLISVADRKLYRMTDDFNLTPLQVVIRKRRMEAVELLAEADPDQLSSGTLLLYALRESHGKTDDDDDISVKIRRLLLEKQPNACKMRIGKREWPALHYAAFAGDLAAIDDIIRFCPDSVHMVDKDGNDFLDFALMFGSAKTVKKIFQKENLHLANKMSKREMELCIPPEYLVLYRELVKQFGEIVEPSKYLEDTPMYAALGHFLGHVYEMAHVKTENVTQEKISEWEKMAAEYSALGLQLSWFEEIVTQFAKRAEHARHFVGDIVTKEAEIASKKEALKILKNELNELEIEVAKLKEQQRDAYTPGSDDPLAVIRRIEGRIPANSTRIYDFDF